MECPQCHHANPSGTKFCGECGTRLQVLCPACKPPTLLATSSAASAASPAPAAPAPTATPAAASATPPSAAGSAPAPARYASPSPTPRSTWPRRSSPPGAPSRASARGHRDVLRRVGLHRDVREARSRGRPRHHGPRLRGDPRARSTATRARSTSSSATASWRCSARRSPTRTTPIARCSAALAIQDGLEPLADDVRARRTGSISGCAWGSTPGLVVVGAIGRDLRMDYTAVGDTTNLAARLLGIAKPGQIVVSRRTQHLRDGFFVFEDLGDFQVKGKAEPVRAYAVSERDQRPHQARGLEGARAHPAGRPRPRARGADRSPPAGRRRPGRASSLLVGRAGGRQVPPALRVPAPARRRRSPRAGDDVRLVRPRHGVPPDHGTCCGATSACRRGSPPRRSGAASPSSFSSSACEGEERVRPARPLPRRVRAAGVSQPPVAALS